MISPQQSIMLLIKLEDAHSCVLLGDSCLHCLPQCVFGSADCFIMCLQQLLLRRCGTAGQSFPVQFCCSLRSC